MQPAWSLEPLWLRHRGIRSRSVLRAARAAALRLGAVESRSTLPAGRRVELAAGPQRPGRSLAIRRRRLRLGPGHARPMRADVRAAAVGPALHWPRSAWTSWSAAAAVRGRSCISTGWKAAPAFQSHLLIGAEAGCRPGRDRAAGRQRAMKRQRHRLLTLAGRCGVSRPAERGRSARYSRRGRLAGAAGGIGSRRPARGGGPPRRRPRFRPGRIGTWWKPRPGRPCWSTPGTIPISGTCRYLPLVRARHKLLSLEQTVEITPEEKALLLCVNRLPNQTSAGQAAGRGRRPAAGNVRRSRTPPAAEPDPIYVPAGCLSGAGGEAASDAVAAGSAIAHRVAGGHAGGHWPGTAAGVRRSGDVPGAGRGGRHGEHR